MTGAAAYFNHAGDGMWAKGRHLVKTWTWPEGVPRTGVCTACGQMGEVQGDAREQPTMEAGSEGPEPTLIDSPQPPSPRG